MDRPLNNSSGTFAAGTNAYNGSNQYNFATKHDGHLFFNATNGGNDTTPSNPRGPPLRAAAAAADGPRQQHRRPLQPDHPRPVQRHAHRPVRGFTYNGTHYTGDQAAVAQGDNFLSMIVPQIMASQAYKNNGAIVIWFDETEGGDTKHSPWPRS